MIMPAMKLTSARQPSSKRLYRVGIEVVANALAGVAAGGDVAVHAACLRFRVSRSAIGDHERPGADPGFGSRQSRCQVATTPGRLTPAPG